MNSKYKKALIATGIAAVIGITGAAVADMGGFGAGCPRATGMEQGYGGYGPGMGYGGHGPMHRHEGRGMYGYGRGMHGPGANYGGMHGPGYGGMPGGGMGFGFGLDLSEEQRAEMGKLRNEMLPVMGELRGKMLANHEQLRALHRSGAADPAEIEKLADQKGDLMAEMIKLRAQHHARMQALLTEEQREKMREHRPGMGLMGPGAGPMGG